MTKANSPLSFFLTIRKNKPSKERVKMAIDNIKMLLQVETDEGTRRHLAGAGLELNSILLKL
jgi:hypothetical protein